jgi:F-type H+-transporting ATPase subunit b
MDKIINDLNTNSHIMVWFFITFVALLIILGKWGWPAIIGALEAREKGIQDDLDEAREGRDEVRQLLEEHKSLMAGTDDKIRAIVDEAKRDAVVIKDEIEAKAKEEAELIRQRSLKDIELAKDAAIGSLREESVHLATNIASKLISREITATDHKALVEESLKEL